MTTFNLTCDAVEATLADYLDETLEEWVRESIDEHLSECARCRSLARDLRNMAREAAALPALLPEGDVWPRVAGRIGAPAIVSRPEAKSAPLTSPSESIGLPTDVALPTSEPLAVGSELAVLTSEPLAVESELPVLTSETPLLTEELSVSANEPLATEPLRFVGTASAPTTEPASPLPRRNKNFGPRWMGLAAAALVLVTAGTTFLLTVQWLGPAHTANVASDTRAPKRSSSERATAERGGRGPSPAGVQTPLDSSTLTPVPGQLGSAVLVSATSAREFTPSPEEVVYDKEIIVLQRIVRRQRAELDTSTVTVIEKNLRTVDSAIAQIRAALKEDPRSSLLGGQASRALEMKVELLRRAAMLRTNT